MRVLFITSHGNLIYGGEKSLLVLLRELRSQDVSVTVVCPETGIFVDALKSECFETIICPLYNLTKKTVFGYADSMCQVWGIIRKYKPDLIHCNSSSIAQIAIPASKLWGLPVVVHIRTVLDRTNTRRYLLNHADTLIFNSKFSRGTTMPFLPPAPDNVVVYNPIEKIIQKENSYANNAVLFLGQLAPHKGCDTFLRMAKQLIGKGCPATYIIAGGEIPSAMGYAEELKNYTRDLGIVDQVLFVHGTDADVLLAGAAVVVVPSRNETFGRVAAEAMMAGRPVIASRVGGLPEVVEDNITGFLVGPDDVEGFADKVQFLLNNPEKANIMGQAGRERAIRLFSPQRHADQVMEVYTKVMA